MRDARGAALRAALIILLLANVILFAYLAFAPDPRAQAAARIEELQMNPGRIVLLGVANQGAGSAAPEGKRGKTAPFGACLEWGPFTAADAARVDSALARLALRDTPLQRPLNEAVGAKRYAYFLREPDPATVSQIAELRRNFPGTEIKAGPCPG